MRTKAGRAISRKSVERAIAAWREVATIREVETFLFTHGISAGLAARLVRRYGDEVVAVLTHDPYRLVELPRVGFKIADGIARSLGVELDDPQRLQAGLRFVLEEAESDGNTFLPLGGAVAARRRSCSAWGSSIRSSPRCVPSPPRRRSSSRASGSIASSYGRWSVAWPRLSASGSARRRSSCSRSRSGPAVDVSDEQWAVVELVRTRPLVLLTGLPGAGKTHTQRALVEISRRARKRVLLCAPTGKAARRMRDLTGHEAMTIHRALGYSPNEGGFRARRALAALERLRPDHRRRGIDALARAGRRALPCGRRLSCPARRRHRPAAADRRRPRARRSRRLRHRSARSSDRDLPAGGAIADHPERPADQRGRAAVPLAGGGPRGARRGCGARRGLLLHRSARPRVDARGRASSSSASESPRASGSIRERR